LNINLDLGEFNISNLLSDPNAINFSTNTFRLKGGFYKHNKYYLICFLEVFSSTIKI